MNRTFGRNKMKRFSWYTIPDKITDLSTVYQYAVDRFIPLEVDRHGFGSYIHVKAGTFVTRHDGGWQRYKPNRKGGHRHNHIYNACHRIVFRGKASRRLSDWSDKREFVEIFYTNLRLHPGYLSETLQRKWRKR